MGECSWWQMAGSWMQRICLRQADKRTAQFKPVCTEWLKSDAVGEKNERRTSKARRSFKLQNQSNKQARQCHVSLPTGVARFQIVTWLHR